jgi:hypothetical protein
MLLMTELLLLALAFLAWAPDTQLGKTLRAWLIDAPARAITDLTLAKVVVGAIVLVCLVGWAISAPELVAMIGFGDLAVYLDAAVIAVLLSATERLRVAREPAIRLSRIILGRFLTWITGSRTRQTRLRRQKPRPSGTSDDVYPRGGRVFT